jgi:hypothetical protein
VNSSPPMPLQPGGGTGRGWLGCTGWAALAGLAGLAVWLLGLAGWPSWAGLAGWVAGLGWLAGLAGLAWLARLGWLGWAGWDEISDLMSSRRMYLYPSGSFYLLCGSSILRESHVFMFSDRTIYWIILQCSLPDQVIYRVILQFSLWIFAGSGQGQESWESLTRRVICRFPGPTTTRLQTATARLQRLNSRLALHLRSRMPLTGRGRRISSAWLVWKGLLLNSFIVAVKFLARAGSPGVCVLFESWLMPESLYVKSFPWCFWGGFSRSRLEEGPPAFGVCVSCSSSSGTKGMRRKLRN